MLNYPARNSQNTSASFTRLFFRQIGAAAVLTVFLLQNIILGMPVQAWSTGSAIKLAPSSFVSPDIVISQVYGGGGNAGATFTHDFIELFNRGSATVNITGWSVQYASSAGTTWTPTTLSGSVAPGQYYLVQQAQGAGGSTPLPTPDAIGAIAMSGTNGKIALSNTSTALSGSCPSGLVDLAGYGSANCFEGTAATAVLTNTTAAIRAANGCTDTDQNSTDFATGAPIPRNSATALNPCGPGGPTNPTGVGAANPSSVNAGSNSLLTVTVTPGTNPTSTGLAVSVNLTAIGGSATQTFFDDGTNGDVTIGDNIFSYNATVGAMTTGGSKNLAFSISDAQTRMGSGSITLIVNAPPGPVNHVVISQVYGGGGNSGATYSHDFLELYNPTMSSVDLSGWSVQYASATGTTWSGNQPIGGAIGPGEYYLISLATGGAVGAPLPAANIVGDINMSGTAGKVALVNNSTVIPNTCPTMNANVVDLVGYGTTANCFEGAGSAPAPSNTTSDLRKSNGAQDTNDNAADFLTGVPNPRRTAPIVEIGPSVFFVDPQNNNTIAPRDASMTVTFTEPVFVDPNWFDITCTTTGQHNSATTVGANTKTHVITPNVNFVAGESCTVTIFKDFVHDVDTNDTGPNDDNLPADYVWSFTVATGNAPPYPASVHLTMGNPSGAVVDTNQPNNYLMEKAELALSYDRDRGIPNWVSWHLETAWTGSLVRIDTFRPDPQVPSSWYRVQAFDYSGSGFDRGHMTPNADRDNENARPINQATFLMTNMIPQAPDNNQGPWAVMENDLRALMTTNEIYIVSGGVGTGGTGSNGGVTNTVGGGNVSVPAYTWKAALILPIGTNDLSRVDNNTRIISVIMPNTQGIRNDNWRRYLSTVDQIEAMTGYDLFSNVSPAIQQVIESRLDAASNTAPPTVAGGTVTDLNITGPNTTLTGNVTVNGILTLGGSHLVTNGFTITLGPNATVTRLGGYVIGNLEKQFVSPPPPAAPAGPLSFIYHVGTLNGYSPVTADVTAMGISPSSLTVSAVQAVQPNLPHPLRALKRYWVLTENGDLTTNLTFQYIDADIPVGIMENSFVIQRYNGAITTMPTTLNTAANTATTNGISEFSDWTIVGAFGPTAANANVGGRVLSADGKAVFGATVMMVDQSGNVLMTRTNPFGYYHFYNVPVGGDFVFSVRHKQYVFAARSITVTDDIGDLIIVANP